MTKSIDLFAEVALTYCSLVDRHNDFSTEEFVARVRNLLPQLYFHALALPNLESTDKEIGRICHEEWRAVFTSLQHKLGINDLYWEIYDPIKLDHEAPVAASLSDDLADIWSELKTGISLWPDCSDTIRQQIVLDWHFSFHHHWSNHVVDALRALNWITEFYGVR